MGQFRVFVILLSALSLSTVLNGHPRSAPPGNAGAPGDANPPCSSCHRVTLNPAGGKVEVTSADGLTWQRGQKKSLTVRITEPDTSRRYGFELTTRPAGTLAAPSGSNTAISGAYIYHTASQSSYTFDWTPPADAVSEILLYVAALTGRGTSNSNVYTATYTLAPQQQATPRLDSAKPAVNGASFLPGISAGSWVTLFGENLAPVGTSRTWRADEIVSGKLPLALDGVSVKINNRDAAVYFISPTQINAQAPDDAATGPVSVQVTTAAGTSAAGTVNIAPYAPAFFCFDPQERRYPAALSAQYETIAPSGLFGASLESRPAKPGETILLYGTGFGPTSPSVASGAVFQGAASLAEPASLRVTIGGVTAQVSFAGLTGAGLYQFNVVVPELPDGDHMLSAQIASVQTQPGVYLAVKR